MKKLCKKRNTDFELLKKIIGKIQLSKIRAMFLVLGVLVSSIITFVRPQIVSTLTDNGLVKKNWGDCYLVVYHFDYMCCHRIWEWIGSD